MAINLTFPNRTKNKKWKGKREKEVEIRDTLNFAFIHH